MSETNASPEKLRSLVEAMTVPALQRLAKELKLSPYSKLTKDRLVTLILKVDSKDLARHLYVPCWRPHLGVVLWAIGIGLALLLFALSVFLTPNVEEIVRKVAAENKRILDAKFPKGYGVLGIVPTGLVVPKGLMPDGMEIDWGSGKVLEFSDTEVKVEIPAYKPFPNVTVKGTLHRLDKRVGAESRSGITIGLASPTGENRRI